ncbi:MAG TPA: polyprenyl synthetase family protein [Jiangellales bacterium]|nr:polyprenyl synthetase family protein [Jiangellales bacterium]
MPSTSGLGIPAVDPVLATQVADGLDEVEARLRESVTSEEPLLTEASRHLIDAGGKRFRPLLVLLASHFGDPRAEGVVPAALVVELTHLATLYHDDVMDEAALRRGAPSANARWSNSVAILTGDYLFARASDIVADLGPECVRLQARTFERLVRGQLRETVGPPEGADPLEHYLSVLADKTGSLIATSARFGAMLSGAGPEVVDVVTRYGERIGVAFQLADDVLDIASESTESGKTPGTDLREGVPTLPVHYALRSDDPGDSRLRRLLSAPVTDDDVHAEVLDALRAHPAMEQARREVARWAGEARDTLDPLPDGPARRALQALCDGVVDRTS